MSGETDDNLSQSDESSPPPVVGAESSNGPPTVVDEVGLKQSQKAFSRGSMIWLGITVILVVLYFVFPSNNLISMATALGVPLFAVLAVVSFIKSKSHAAATDALSGAVEYKLLVEILPRTSPNQYGVTIVDQPGLPPLKFKKLIGKQPGLPGIMKISKNPSEASVFVDPKTNRVLAVVTSEGTLFANI